MSLSAHYWNMEEDQVHAIRHINDKGQERWQPVCEGDGLFRTSTLSIVPRLHSDDKLYLWQKHDAGLGPMLYRNRRRAESMGRNEKARRDRKRKTEFRKDKSSSR